MEPLDFTALEKALLAGGELPIETARYLIGLPEGHPDCAGLFDLSARVRKAVHGNRLELCAIQNARSGRCSEDCRFCAQSAQYQTHTPTYPLLSGDAVLEQAKSLEAAGVHRFSLVISGHRVEPETFEKLLHIYRKLQKHTGLSLCASLGALDDGQVLALKEAGVSRYHHNLETSEAFYSSVCTTHAYSERLETLAACRRNGLEVCSGGIIGMGETLEDRIALAYTLRREGVHAIPLNILHAVPGTPLENLAPLDPFEILKTGAVYSLINPFAVIRYAGGRIHLGEAFVKGYHAGISGVLTGDYLTTTGKSVREDIRIALAAGFIPEMAV